MSQHQRAISEGSVYHVTSRGVAQQSIFEDDTDRRYMLELLSDSSHKYRVEIYAWCFMGNHVHLLLHAPMQDISLFMNSVLSRYAKRFNTRHARSGHLFQDRFYSSPIGSDEYLLVAVRYIHFNPIGIGVHNLAEYQWSSYREYLGSPGLCSPRFVLSVFGGLTGFLDFHAAPNNDQMMYSRAFEGDASRSSQSDDFLIAYAKSLLGIDHISAIAQSSTEDRDRMLCILKSRLTIRQIARITGLGRNIIQRAHNESITPGVFDSSGTELCDEGAAH